MGLITKKKTYSFLYPVITQQYHTQTRDSKRDLLRNRMNSHPEQWPMHQATFLQPLRLASPQNRMEKMWVGGTTSLEFYLLLNLLISIWIILQINGDCGQMENYKIIHKELLMSISQICFNSMYHYFYFFYFSSGQDRVNLSIKSQQKPAPSQ